MAKTKAKKKYVPKMVRIPSLITHLYSFSGFEAALSKVLETGQIQIDEVGKAVYIDNAGRQLSFSDTLGTYIDIVDLYARRNGRTTELPCMKKLQGNLYKDVVVDEEEIEAAQAEMDFCKRVIATIKPSELLDITQTLRTRMRMSHIPD